MFCLPSSLSSTSEEFKKLNIWQTVLRFDPMGTTLLLGSLTCLMLALQWGGAQYAWNSGRVIAVLVVFGLTIIPWLALQYYQGDDATLPFSILKQRTVASSSVYLLFMSASFGVLIFFLPVWYVGLALAWRMISSTAADTILQVPVDKARQRRGLRSQTACSLHQHGLELNRSWRNRGGNWLLQPVCDPGTAADDRGRGFTVPDRVQYKPWYAVSTGCDLA